MNPTPSARRLDCSEFGDRLFHFQADELEEELCLAMQRHLDACPGCARRMDLEQALLGAVKRRLVRGPAPRELELRVREALAREVQGPRGVASWRAPWLRAVAASAVLALVLLPGLRGLARMAAELPVLASVSAEVVVVDLDCDRAGVEVVRQRGCDHPQHVNALKNEQGGYWHLGVDDPAVRPLVLDPRMRGHRLEVQGELDRRTGAFRLKRFIDRGLSV